MSVTLHDIAKACAVNVSTVSRALRDDPRVKPETRVRIRQTAQELGYRPNLAARALVVGSTQTVWLILSSLPNALERELAQYASSYLSGRDYDLLVALYHHNPDIYLRLINRLTQGVADGALILPGPNQDPEGVLQTLAVQGYPLVFLDRHVESVKATTVTTDNEAGSRQLVKLGLEAGAEFGFVLHSEQNSVEKVRKQGTVAELQAQKCPFLTIEETMPETPTIGFPRNVAIFGTGQPQIQRFITQYADTFKKKVLYVGCFDRWHGEPFPAEKVIVCHQDFEQMARLAVDQILTLIAKETIDRPQRIIKVPPLKYQTIIPSF